MRDFYFVIFMIIIPFCLHQFLKKIIYHHKQKRLALVSVDQWLTKH